jgi:CheY-like chemotaxis protein
VGQNLLKVARQVLPVVIIFDAELPGELRGWEAARALKADATTCNIPIIDCSWLSKTEVVALIGEVAGHLQKPELCYEDFVSALSTAGVTALPYRDT